MDLSGNRRNFTKMVIYPINIDGTNKAPIHPEIQMLERELKKLFMDNKLKGINLYIYGLVLKEQ